MESEKSDLCSYCSETIYLKQKCIECHKAVCTKCKVYNCNECSEDAETEEIFLCQSCVIKGEFKVNIFKEEKRDGICVRHYLDVDCTDCRRSFNCPFNSVQECGGCCSELCSSCAERLCKICEQEEERNFPYSVALSLCKACSYECSSCRDRICLEHFSFERDICMECEDSSVKI